MNIDNQAISKKLKHLQHVLLRFAPFIFIIITLSVYIWLILYIDKLTVVRADEEEVAGMLEITTRPQIDQAAVDAIKELQDQNIQIESLFEEARDNPFAETSSDE